MDGNTKEPGSLELLRRSWPVLLLVVLGLIAYLDLKADYREIARHLEDDAATPLIRSLPPVDGPASPSNVAKEQARVEGPSAAPQDTGSSPETSAPAAEPRVFSPECTGHIPEETLLEVLTHADKGVYECYRKALAQDPEFRAKLEFLLHVTSEGKVLKTRVENAVMDYDLTPCMADELTTWQFPPPEGGDCAVVTLPFEFDPSDHAPAAE
jgi:hypothetical protein